MRLMGRVPARLFVIVACGFAVACGGQSDLVIAKGKVLKDGSPIPMDGKDRLVLKFRTNDPNLHDAIYNGVVKRDGSFEVRGDTGDGIPKGTYRVGVSVHAGILAPDKLGGKFGQDNSPIVREVNGEDEITVDIGQPN